MTYRPFGFRKRRSVYWMDALSRRAHVRRDGRAVLPPGDAGQSLPRHPLDVREGLVFIEVPAVSLALERRNR